MKELLRDVIKAEKAEMNRANEKNPLFRSNHEGIGVILEELCEASDEFCDANELFAALSSCVFDDDTEAAREVAKELKQSAYYAACEMIQVAAMAEKFNMDEESFSQEEADAIAETLEGEKKSEALKDLAKHLNENPDQKCRITLKNKFVSHILKELIKIDEMKDETVELDMTLEGTNE